MQKKTLVVVTGGRDYANVEAVRWALTDHLNRQYVAARNMGER